MSRLIVVGGETNAPFLESYGVWTPGPVTISTSAARTGTYGIRCNPAANAGMNGMDMSPSSGVFGRTYYSRGYMRITDLPDRTSTIISVSNTTVYVVSVRLTSTGVLQLWTVNTGTGLPLAQIGSDSSITLGTNTWYRMELRILFNTGATDEIELRVDGSTVFNATAQSLSDASFLHVKYCYGTTGTDTPSASVTKTIDYDDGALNDDQGTAQNSWPGDGGLVLLIPTSDNSAGSWRAGSAASAAANGALFQALNNLPPTGTATPNAVGNAISNTISGATSPNGDFNMTTYTAAGVPTGATINCVTMWIAHGEDVATGTKTGTFNIVSNPSSSTATVQAFGFATGVFGTTTSAAVDAFPSTLATCNWGMAQGTFVYNPTVTLGTAPVARITKTDTGSRAADLCFMGIYVDYTPAAAGSLLPPSRARRVYRM